MSLIKPSGGEQNKPVTGDPDAAWKNLLRKEGPTEGQTQAARDRTDVIPRTHKKSGKDETGKIYNGKIVSPGSSSIDDDLPETTVNTSGVVSAEDDEVLKKVLYGTPKLEERDPRAPGSKSTGDPLKDLASLLGSRKKGEDPLIPGKPVGEVPPEMDPKDPNYKMYQMQKELQEAQRENTAMQLRAQQEQQRLSMLTACMENQKAMENMIRTFLSNMYKMEQEMRQSECESRRKVGEGWIKALG